MPTTRRFLSAADARNQLADALRQAEAGDLVLITRYRKPVAALIGGERLERLQRLDDAPGEDAPGEDARGGEAIGGGAVASGVDGRGAGETAAPPVPAPAPPAAARLRLLRDRAAAGSLRRIEADLARVSERLKPALRLIRANLFQPRFNVERLQAALKRGAHDFTTEFHRAAGAPIHRYLSDRRLETAARLLVDTELPIKVIARVAGYGGQESLSRAFAKRYGVRPTIYREFEGRLSPEVAGDAAADLPPQLPRYLAGTAALVAGTACGRCGEELEAGTAMRVFEDLAQICNRCARAQAPELGALPGLGEAG